MTTRRVLVAAGGTAGHVMPAFAVAEELVRAGAEVTFAGTPERAEAQLVPARGYPFDAFRVQGLPRRPSVDALRALALDIAAPAACIRILRRRRPHAVLGGGGFVAGPMLLAARTLGIPRVLTEADAHLGLANRWAAPIADKVFLAYPLAGREPPHYEVVGRPVSRAYFETTRAEARAELNLPGDAFVLAVFGALAGARRLNDAAVAAYGDGLEDGIVVHVTGARDYDQVTAAVRAPAERYRALASTDRFWSVLAAADLAVSRSGGTVWELAAAGLPALLVPYPHATSDHQRANAEHFAAAGGAVIVDDAALDGDELRRRVAELRAEPGRLDAMREGMLSCARPDAAAAVARELLRLARGRT